jgi:hypothetical protein
MTLNKQKIINGISAYSREQKVLLRLIDRSGGLTQSKFDELFIGREWRRGLHAHPIDGDSFLLGASLVNGGTEWAFYLDLQQHMMMVGSVDTIRNDKNEIVYIRPNGSEISQS